jgi:glycosyltransferase involved in cell wall biosynthesis
MNKKNKILIFHPYFRFGGVERTNLRLSKIFLHNGYEIEIVTFNHTDELKSEIDDLGIKIIDLGVSRVVLSILPLINYIRTQINEHNIILLSNQNYVNIISIFVKLYFKNKIKLVMTERNHPIELTLKDERIKNKIILFLMKYLYKYADKIVTISSTMKKNIENITNTKVSLIFNPSYDESIIPMSEVNIYHPYFNKNNKIIVSVGRLEKQKNYMMLLKAFYKIAKDIENLKLIIVGEGSERILLEDYIIKNNLQEKIDLVGYQANPFPLIKNADLFVLTSLWEGFGNVLVEAITLDTPVVSTNCLSGPNDILLDGQGGD